MTERRSGQVGLRERTRRTVQAQIAEKAMELFISQGFDQTTLEQIAAAVGISGRSVSRYFSGKGDMAVGHLFDLGHDVADALEARPGDETAWTALRAALDVATAAILTDKEGLRATAVILQTPALRAAMADKHIYWAQLLVPCLLARGAHQPDAAHPGSGAAQLEAEAAVFAALACLHVAIAAWVASTASKPLPGLLDTAFAAVRP